MKEEEDEAAAAAAALVAEALLFAEETEETEVDERWVEAVVETRAGGGGFWVVKVVKAVDWQLDSVKEFNRIHKTQGNCVELIS